MSKTIELTEAINSDFGNFTELRGAATITNRVAIDLAPGLIAKEVQNAIQAGGNLRGDTGVSMNPSSILPR
jgi:hypothetical protein